MSLSFGEEFNRCLQQAVASRESVPLRRLFVWVRPVSGGVFGAEGHAKRREKWK